MTRAQRKPDLGVVSIRGGGRTVIHLPDGQNNGALQSLVLELLLPLQLV